MKAIILSSALLVSAGLATASAQTPSVSIHAAGGPTLVDTGHNLSAGLSFSPLSRVTFTLDAERTHLNSRITESEDPGGHRVTSSFRGGTMNAVTGSVRVSLFPEGRLTPYVLAGMGRGVSKPNVNEQFPTPVTNDAVFGFAGAGLSIPAGRHLSLFADARLMVGGEGNDGTLVIAPLRAGVNWRF